LLGVFIASNATLSNREFFAMKLEIPLLTAIGFIMFSQFGSAQAIPLYYTFEGTVATYPISDDAGFMEDIGLTEGDSVSYTFMVDSSRQGTYRNESGDLVEDQDRVYVGSQSGGGPVTNFIFHDSFYVELVESSVFDLVQNLYPDQGNDEPWTGSGYANTSYRNGVVEPGFGEVSLSGSSASIGSSSLYIYGDMASWQVGNTVSADNVTELNGLYPDGGSRFRSDLVLSAISTINPTDVATSLVSGVTGGGSDYSDDGLWLSSGSSGGSDDVSSHDVPEPSTFLLLGLGLLGIGAGRFRK
jgi:hypothetical protein